MKHALGRPHGLRWNALKVFNATNRATIKAEIERAHPSVKGVSNGHFKYWVPFKTKCFNMLSKRDKKFYTELADKWNWFGTTDEEKAL